MIYRKEVSIKTNGNDDIVDITHYAIEALNDSKVKDGILLIFVVGSTASITTIEYESGLVHDLKKILNELIPCNPSYKHHLAWNDDNGHSHLRASLIGPSIAIPFKNGKLDTGTWQQIVLIDFDTRPRSRTIIFQIVS